MTRNSDLLVNCKVCDKGLIHKTGVRRFSGWVTFFGYLILIPAELMFVLELLVVGTSAGALLNAGKGGFESFSMFAVVATVWGYPIMFATLVMITCGFLLVDKRKVLQCDNCGAVVPRQ